MAEKPTEAAAGQLLERSTATPAGRFFVQPPARSGQLPPAPAAFFVVHVALGGGGFRVADRLVSPRRFASALSSCPEWRDRPVVVVTIGDDVSRKYVGTLLLALANALGVRVYSSDSAVYLGARILLTSGSFVCWSPSSRRPAGSQPVRLGRVLPETPRPRRRLRPAHVQRDGEGQALLRPDSMSQLVTATGPVSTVDVSQVPSLGRPPAFSPPGPLGELPEPPVLPPAPEHQFPVPPPLISAPPDWRPLPRESLVLEPLILTSIDLEPVELEPVELEPVELETLARGLLLSEPRSEPVTQDRPGAPVLPALSPPVPVLPSPEPPPPTIGEQPAVPGLLEPAESPVEGSPGEPPAVAPASVPVPPTPASAPEVLRPARRWLRVAPAAASEDWDRLRSVIGTRYEEHAQAVAGMLALRPGLRASIGDDRLAGLVAVRAHLFDTELEVDAVLRGEPYVLSEASDPGLEEMERREASAALLARCVVSGLRRLPTVVGPVYRPGILESHVLDRYWPGARLVEPAFTEARLTSSLRSGDTVEYAIWSSTGRKTDWVSGAPRVLFAAGSHFLVLGVDDALPGGPVQVMLREVPQFAGNDPKVDDRTRERLRLLPRPTSALSVSDSRSPEARKWYYPVGVRSDGEPFQADGYTDDVVTLPAPA